ncbi:MAG: DUF554 domain-containing protein, partial [Traorella sp.]
AMMKVCGLCVIFIGISGALEGIMQIEGNHLTSGQSMFIVLSLTLGAFVGEWLNIEGLFERFGEWLKIKSGNSKDITFVEGFLTASFTVCIGAMAIVGAIQDGLFGDFSILATKGILDFIIIMIMTCTFGKGAAFSAIPVFILQGSMSILARFIQPLMNDLALSNLSMIGSILIFCVGLNLVWGQKVRVANLLPSLILAILFSFI